MNKHQRIINKIKIILGDNIQVVGSDIVIKRPGDIYLDLNVCTYMEQCHQLEKYLKIYMIPKERQEELLKKVAEITGNPTEIAQGTFLIKFTHKGQESYIDLSVADYCEKRGQLKQYFK